MAKGIYYSKFKVVPEDMNVVSDNGEEIIIRAIGKDKRDNPVDVNITIKKYDSRISFLDNLYRNVLRNISSLSDNCINSKHAIFS